MTTLQYNEAVLNAYLALTKFLAPTHRPMGQRKKWEEGASEIASLTHEQVAGMHVAIEIFDLNDELLFYDFMMTLKSGQMLRIRAAGDTRLSAPVVSIGYEETWDLEMSTRLARAKSKEAHLLLVGDGSRIYCYSYPKIGILARDKHTLVAIDLFEHTIVPLTPNLAEGGVSETLGGYSFFTMISGRNPPPEPYTIKLDLSIPAAKKLSAPIDEIAAGLIVEEFLSDDVPLIGQETSYHCAPACAQMILTAMGFDFTQADIAVAMGTVYPGTIPEAQEKGIELICSNAIDAVIDIDPTYLEVKNTLKSGGKALKNGIANHARVTCGYRIVRDTAEHEEQWIFIHDPWPIGSGRAYWEHWTINAMVILNHMYLVKVIPTS